MKFYKDKNFYLYYIRRIKLTAILYYNSTKTISFFKNGIWHNYKNAAYIRRDRLKEFYLNGKCYGYEYHFTKKLWRRFVKMKVFL